MMKISLYLPTGTKDVRDFLQKEIALTFKIKSKKTRDDVQAGLKKILGYVSKNPQEIENKQGYAFFVDTTDFAVVPYDGQQKIYHCGKELIMHPFTYLFDSNKFLLVAMDLNHCTIGVLHGKNIKVLWDKEFYIQGKHRKGGQSAARYERDREEQKKKMYKTVAMKLQEMFGVVMENQEQPKDITVKSIFKKFRVKKLRMEDEDGKEKT